MWSTGIYVIDKLGGIFKFRRWVTNKRWKRRSSAKSWASAWSACDDACSWKRGASLLLLYLQLSAFIVLNVFALGSPLPLSLSLSLSLSLARSYPLTSPSRPSMSTGVIYMSHRQDANVCFATRAFHLPSKYDVCVCVVCFVHGFVLECFVHYCSLCLLEWTSI